MIKIPTWSEVAQMLKNKEIKYISDYDDIECQISEFEKNHLDNFDKIAEIDDIENNITHDSYRHVFIFDNKLITVIDLYEPRIINKIDDVIVCIGNNTTMCYSLKTNKQLYIDTEGI